MAGLFKVVLHASDLQAKVDEIVNVFGYRSNLAVINEESQLATEFIAQILPDILPVLHARTSFYRVEVYNVSNGTGYWDQPVTPPQVGSIGGDSMNAFVSWAFRYNRVTAGKRSGSKRFGIVAESSVSDGEATAGVLAALNTLGTNLSNPIKVGLIDTWFPEILERKPTGVYPWTSHPILGVTFVRVSTQNSRKT
jgi:hypothetical protein